MKALVTGGAGYIGSHTCKALAAEGHETLVYDDLSSGHREFARYGEFVQGNILDTGKLAATIRKWRPDVIIHFAAHSIVGESVRDPGKYFRNNVGGALSMLEAMRDGNVKNIVVSGSSAVYGQPESVPIGETQPLRPINPYGETKLIMENMLADFARAHDIRWTSLRYFNAAGSDPDGEIGELHFPETHLVPRVIMAALGILPGLEIYGDDYPTEDGTCIRDYIHVNDLARAHILAAARLLGGGGSVALNLGTRKGASVREIIMKVQEISGKKIPVSVRERRPGDPPRLIADASLAARELGWTPEKNLGQMLEDAWNFFSSRKSVLESGV